MSAVVAAPDPSVSSAGWPADGDSDVIALLFASSRAERTVLERWVDEAAPADATVRVLDAPDPALEAALSSGGDPCVAPLRVAWLPSERSESRLARLSALLAAPRGRRPLRGLEERILRRDPERWRVLVADPARASDLRSRFDRRREGSGHFADFVRRQGELALDRAERSVIGTQYKVPRFVSEELTASAPFEHAVTGLAEELELPKQEVAEKAAADIEEMVASQSELAIDAWGAFGRWLARAYTIEVDEQRLEQLRAIGARQPLAFLPSHRSYLDPLVMRSALHEHGFAPNHVLGGMNVGFWPIGPVARRSGYIFIRRSFRDNPIYKFALRQYIAYLLRKRFNLEWYIEGGRSRTGKLRPPRYGLLSYVVDAFRDGGVEDVALVPCSIVYDQLYEVGAMAEEEHGGKKSSEGIGWLVGYARAQGRGLGKVRVGFGEPLSLRDALESSEDGGDPRNAVEKVAFDVCHGINRATPITPTGLVSLALLGVEGRALTLGEVRAILDPLLDYVERRALPLSGGLDLREDDALRATLGALAREGVVSCFADGLEPVWTIGPERHLEAAFYRNATVHFFVNRAIAELVLTRAAQERGPALQDEGWNEALRLRDLLKFEFFFARKREFALDIREEMAIFDPDWEARPDEPEEPWALLSGARLHLAHRVLRPFLESYAVVADRLAERGAEEIDEDELVTECIDVARQYQLQQRLHSPESVSKELFRTALRLAANRGLLEAGGEGLERRRRSFADEVHGEVSRVAAVRDLALSELDEPGPGDGS